MVSQGWNWQVSYQPPFEIDGEKGVEKMRMKLLRESLMFWF